MKSAVQRHQAGASAPASRGQPRLATRTQAGQDRLAAASFAGLAPRAGPSALVARAAPPGPATAVAQVVELDTVTTQVEAPPAPVLPPIREINPEFFYSTALDPQQDGIVVVDFFANW